MCNKPELLWLKVKKFPPLPHTLKWYGFPRSSEGSSTKTSSFKGLPLGSQGDTLMTVFATSSPCRQKGERKTKYVFNNGKHVLRFNDFGTTKKKTKKFGGTCKYMRLVYTTPLTAVFPEVRNLLRDWWFSLSNNCNNCSTSLFTYKPCNLW